MAQTNQAPDSNNNLIRNNQRLLWLILFSFGFILLCCGLLVLLDSAAYSPSFGFMAAELCVGYISAPVFQMGFYWSLPIHSYIPMIATAPTHICLSVPYDFISPVLNWLPREILLPP